LLNFFTASPPEAEEKKGEEDNLSAAQRSIIYSKFNKMKHEGNKNEK